MNRRDIEKRAAQLLQHHGVSQAPIPIKEIAEAEGLVVVEMSFNGDISGALIRNHGSSGIAVNATQHTNRKRFTIAHELAHYLLDHKDKDEDHIDWKFTVIRRDGKSSEASDVQEIEANTFAACLLMPSHFLRADLNNQIGFNGEADLDDAHIKAMAKKYRVSEMALRFRLANLGLIPPA
ncbi:ImmA/IrrE family metallo-endopeptidase [Edaphobacter bradus]|uniref:ImmA/IrrE family metallo-endopeptidase n=1 Tax=Edaphobacter bradus TaxID=2259016 RepID=UPI0021DF84CE|nr:ImmA/IrrE family metallo-endopeptidase [Edaphobacter bradus]